VILKLCRGPVRSHLEYNVQAWRPYSTEDIDLIKGVSKGEHLN
jgi:hypothetical protein